MTDTQTLSTASALIREYAIRMGLVVLVAMFVFGGVPEALATKYVVDAAHSSVEFKVRHLVGTVKGKFGKFEGGFTYDSKRPMKTSGVFLAEVASIDTGRDRRDAHLRGPEFFDADKFPVLKVRTGEVRAVARNKYQVETELTMKGVTRKVVFDVDLLGEMLDDGKKVLGFYATATIDRTKFGLEWNKLTEAGGLMVGKNVTIELHVEAREIDK